MIVLFRPLMSLEFHGKLETEDTLENPTFMGAEGVRPVGLNLSGKQTEQFLPLFHPATAVGGLAICLFSE